jgi:nitrogen fixation-related uncharacterized protein
VKSEPLRAVLIPVALAAFAAAVQAYLDGADTRAIITAVLGALVLAGQELARRYVTPTGKADESGLALVEALVLLLVVLVILFAVGVLR